MKEHLYVLVGAKPPEGKTFNPGGQLSMSLGVMDYVASQNYQLEIVDTLQGSFPMPSLWRRFSRGVKRIIHVLKLLNTRSIKGVIIFSANGLSFYERSLIAGIARLYRVNTVFFMLSGLFVDQINKSVCERFLAKVLLKIPTVLAIQGDAWRFFYRRLGVDENKIVTIRNWLPLDYTTRQQPIECKSQELIRFCFIGWLVEAKGVKELFEAINVLAKRYVFEFIFVGGGTLEKELNEKIEENNLAKHVTVTGWVSTEVVKQYLSQSHVFVLPSKAEGFPIALLEAMSLGLPAICTDVGAIADSLFNTSNGYLLKDGSAESIAQAMEQYLLDPELIGQHSTETLRVFREYHDREQNCKVLFDQFNVEVTSCAV